jgi:uncharacterized delta-60 repeat protein
MTAVDVAPFRAFVGYLLCALSALAAITAHAIAGLPGTLDPFWANGSALGSGKLITVVGPRRDAASAIAVQPDGKVLVAGFCQDIGLCAVRYNADGLLDVSFGGNGKLPQVFVPNAANIAPTLALLSSGKFLLAGTCANLGDNDFCVLRFSADGSVDATFGAGGSVITPIGVGDDRARAMLIQPDGKIVISGTCNNGTDSDFCAARYLANGTLDASFGGAGKVVTAFSNRDDVVNAVLLQSDGKLVLAGSCDNGTTTDVCALRYEINGALDPSFGSGGKLITVVGDGYADARALLLQSDGKLLIAAQCVTVSKVDFCTLRYLANGTLDPSFGSGGKLVSSVGIGNDYVTNMMLQLDGKFILAGQCAASGSLDFCAARYTLAGALDSTFGTGGKLTTAISNGATPASSHDYVNAMALQPDGKLLLAGYCRSGSFDKFCVARYDGGPFPAPACSLDIDGDTQVFATTDALIHARIALGIRGDAVVAGMTFPINAQRKTWAQIRGHLVSNCGMTLPP